MEAPISSDSEDGSDESIVILPEDLEDEVDVNIHFHCEHCFKIGKCKEMPKPGWSCLIVDCNYGCGFRFHECKTDEHELLCSHVKVPCLNQNNGCPFSLPRKEIFQHLPVCPASIVICNAEWNRWALGAREREKVAPTSGYTSLYDSNDLDISFALDDQKLVNELHSEPKNLRRILCNGITRRFPSLPLSIRGTHRDGGNVEIDRRAKSQSTTDDDEEPLTPGLSVSVCTSLLRPNKTPGSIRGLRNGHSSDPSRKNSDDISAFCCIHGIMKDMCHFCKFDPDEPNFKIAHVWREKLAFSTPGKVNWTKEPRVEKVRKRGPLGTFVYKQVDDSDDERDPSCKRPENGDDSTKVIGILKRFRTPSPVPLNPKTLNVELTLKDYSKHQAKPQAMFTFQCMQEVRRDQYSAHYQNVHSEIHEGLDGWIMERCPLHIFGCPFSVVCMHPYEKGSLRFSAQLRSFGVTCMEDCSRKMVQPLSRASSVDRSIPLFEGTKGSSVGILDSIPEVFKGENTEHDSDDVDNDSGLNLLMLPIEILEKIASNLDPFTLNSLSMTCKLLRGVAFSLLYDKGLVIQEWVQSTADDGSVRWRNGFNRWFFPKTFSFVDHWRFNNLGSVSNHLVQCPFNIRQISEKKFCYTEGCSDGMNKQMEKLTRVCS